jgi:hypothetical protein
VSGAEAQAGTRSHQIDMRNAQGVVYFAAPHVSLLATLCVLAGIALMGAIAAMWIASRASTRADLAALEVESFKNVLHAHNLPTSAHLPGESP